MLEIMCWITLAHLAHSLSSALGAYGRRRVRCGKNRFWNVFYFSGAAWRLPQSLACGSPIIWQVPSARVTQIVPPQGQIWWKLRNWQLLHIVVTIIVAKIFALILSMARDEIQLVVSMAPGHRWYRVVSWCVHHHRDFVALVICSFQAIEAAYQS